MELSQHRKGDDEFSGLSARGGGRRSAGFIGCPNVFTGVSSDWLREGIMTQFWFLGQTAP